ncbi:MAG: VCBS repeat-containing protein [Planctomycetota bacterium]
MLVASATACSPAPQQADLAGGAASLVSLESRPKSEAAIRNFCGGCHDVPRADRFEKSRWHEEVAQGFRLYRQSMRTDLVPTDFDSTLAYFADRAPENIPIDPPDRILDRRFKAIDLKWSEPISIQAISSLNAIEADDPSSSSLLLTDMGSGIVAKVRPTGTSASQLSGHVPESLSFDVLMQAAHVARTSQADLDGDGRPDWIVADLGTASPQTEQEGSVWWINSDGQQLPLRLGLSRVAEAKPFDYDGDGDQDVLVGDFGLHFEGGIYVGLNQGLVTGRPQMDWRRLDARPGAISFEVVDINQDGLMDYVTLISQHYEMIEVHLNQGNGVFESRVVFHAKDAAYGSSSFTAVDFDHDGDTDFVYTNGDTFDDSLAKPFHGIQWFENRGVYPFTPHRVGWMPGCYCAKPADFDGDGDHDVIAVALLKRKEINRYSPKTFDGVAWFEQLESGEFRSHTMLTDICDAATCCVVDWNHDGWSDVLIPAWPSKDSIASDDVGQTLRLYLNQGR